MSQVTSEQINAEWQVLVDKDDRTSPEEYPDMVLITYDELAAIMQSIDPAGGGEGKAVETMLENVRIVSSETQSSWEMRCYKIWGALGLDFGSPPTIPDEEPRALPPSSDSEKLIEAATLSLKIIAAFAGQTLISIEHGQPYSIGANAAFEQAAGIAAEAIRALERTSNG